MLLKVDPYLLEESLLSQTGQQLKAATAASQLKSAVGSRQKKGV